MANKFFELGGRVALITGGNSGIGLGIAEALASAGSDIIIWGTSDSKNQAAMDKLQAYGVKVICHSIDVSDEETVKRSIGDIITRFGYIDTVVANAGISEMVPSFTELPTEKYRGMLAVNIDGVFFTLREAL